MSETARGSAPLRRVAQILETLATAPEGLALADVARRAGLPTASAHRLLGNMVEAELASTNDRRSLYRIGPRLLRILQLSTSPEKLRQVCEPVLQQAADRFNLTAYLARLAGGQIQLCCAFLPQDAPHMVVHPGHHFPPNATAVGRVLFAHQDEAIIAEAARGPHVGYRPQTPVHANDVREAIEEARARGYATSDDELDPATLAVAVPVRTEGNQLIYSLGLLGLREHFVASLSVEQAVKELRAVAERLGPSLSTAALPLTAPRSKIDTRATEPAS